MIKLIDSFRNGDVSIAIVYADTKAEVTDISDVESACTDLGGEIGAGSVVYTAKREVGVIDSNDNIVWG